MWHVYVLRSEKDNLRYVGMTQDLERRLHEHNAGRSRFTSAHRPWKLVYAEVFATPVEARSREKYFKSAAGKRYVDKKLSAGSLPD
ncbi:MAG: GIY-YIG nuclease family protein [Bacteroidetes bacterium]|nr:GIY-YIG nuclease family protein [Bacteroidota bacterium]MBS1540840.1 GIY-YIG nuclease family protein [Bacteroidota bacterium]